VNVELQIEQGADVNVTDTKGRTPLMWAALGGQLRTVELLVTHGADTTIRDHQGADAVTHAVQNGRNDVLEYFSKLPGFDPAAPDAEGHTLIQWAAHRGFLSLVRSLAEQYNCPIDVPDACGRTALHWAAREGRGDVFTYLLAQGADPDARDHKGSTPAALGTGSVLAAARELQRGLDRQRLVTRVPTGMAR